MAHALRAWADILVQLQKPLVRNLIAMVTVCILIQEYSQIKHTIKCFDFFSQNKAEVTIKENDNPGGTFEFKNTTAVVLQVE